MKKLVFLLIIAVPLVTISTGVYFFLPFTSSAPSQEFVVAMGDSLSLIATRLEKNQIIRHRYPFIISSYYYGLNRSLKAGSFQLSPSDNIPTLIRKLSTGGSRDYWVKIIGGSRQEELIPQLSGAREGYLFPDSYLIPESYTPQQIISVISKNFEQKFSQAKSDSQVDLSDTDAVILASIVEREVRQLSTKQVVAGIFFNRLKLGMPLQADATVQYAKDNLRKPKKYWQPITRADLKIVSPFNTYTNSGLPPSAICNPGYDSLYAVFHPIESDYLYYITDDQGQIHYGKTLEEHNQNIARYLK